MKKMMITVVLVAVVCLGASKAQAGTVYYNEPISYEINTVVNGWDGGAFISNGATVNIVEGGQVTGNLELGSGCTLNVDTGIGNWATSNPQTDEMIDAQAGSLINLYSGYMEGTVALASEINIFGGYPGTIKCIESSGVINVYGIDFQLDGQPVDYGQITIGGSDETTHWHRLIGTLSSGEAYLTDGLSIWSPQQSSATINLIETPPMSATSVMLSSLGQFIEDEVALGYIDPVSAVSLMAKVNGASSALARGNPNDAKVAMNDLKALINQVEAQMNKKIDPITAQAIIDSANDIIAALGG